jgi:hypothetical protein
MHSCIFRRFAGHDILLESQIRAPSTQLDPKAVTIRLPVRPRI